MQSFRFWCAIVVAAMFTGRPVAADYLTIYGSPMYDFISGGYQAQGETPIYFNGGVLDTEGKAP